MTIHTPDIPEPKAIYPLFTDYERRLWQAVKEKNYYKDAIIARYVGVLPQHIRFWRRLSLSLTPETSAIREFFQHLNEIQASEANLGLEALLGAARNNDDPDKIGRAYERALPELRPEEADTVAHGITGDKVEEEYRRAGVAPQEWNTEDRQARAGQEGELKFNSHTIRGPAIGCAQFATRYYPSYTSVEFALWHRELMDWATALQYGQPPYENLTAIVNRDGGKSTIAEIIMAFVMATGRRGYGMYICGTQRQANDHVMTISGLLQSKSLNEDYEKVAEVAIDRNSRALGWNNTRLTSAAGFTIDAIGIDTQIRGAKIDEKRVDFVILDDIDDSADTPARVEKKLDALGRKIFPAGSGNLAALGIQNLISDYSVFARIKDKSSDVMRSRVIGPIPAIEDLKTDPKDPINTFAPEGVKVLSGRPTWPGFDLSKAQNMINLIGIRAFMAEHQHNVGVMGGVAFAAHWKKQFVEVDIQQNPPPEYVIRRVYDYGSSRPWSYANYAEADGETPIIINGKLQTPPAGTLLFLREIYGWTGAPNTGTNRSSSEHADEINAEEAAYPFRNRIESGPADASIFDQPDNGESIAKIHRVKGIHWLASNKNPGSRKAGAEIFRQMLGNTICFALGAFPLDKNGVEVKGPCFYIDHRCENFIRTIPNLPSDKKPGKDGDVDTNAEDHPWDCVRYAILNTGALTAVELKIG